MSYLFTSESVTEGHPDKVCDQISDAVVDAALREDPYSRVACECFAKSNFILIGGEMTTKARFGGSKIEQVARETLRDIGYTDESFGIGAGTCRVMVRMEEQSPDIALGVDADPTRNKDQGAGDQGMMFGYACDETQELMPLPIQMAHRLTRRLAEVRKDGTVSFLRPDGKSQVTIEYSDLGLPQRLHTVVVSAHHADGIPHETIREEIRTHVIGVVCSGYIDGHTLIHVNPTGKFVVGGPRADSGLTGRKIIVDTYGGYGRHGGGAFSGKDPSKVDRSATYAARWIAKNIVKAGFARKCEVQIAYAIGVAEPVSIHVETFGTALLSDRELERAIREVFDLRPAAIIENLELLKPQYRQLAAYGHMGREELGVKWEECDRIDALREALAPSHRIQNLTEISKVK